MDPALDPLTVPAHVEAPAEAGPASLAMAMAALEPDRDPVALADALEEPDPPDPRALALAALERGFHAILHGPALDPDGSSPADDAGLLHREEGAGVRHVVAALEAGHPALVLVDRRDLHASTPEGPHWICLVDHDEETVHVHDPLLESGPTTVGWEKLSGVMGVGPHRYLLELGPATRVDRG